MSCPVVGLERQAYCPVRIGRVARGHAPDVEQVGVALLPERRPRPEVFPESFVRAVVVVPQRPRHQTELGEVGVLEQRVARMGRQAAPEVRTEHRRNHGSVPAARLAADRAVFGSGERAMAGIHPRHELVAEIGVVVAGPRRVEELAAAERRPRVDEDDDRRRNGGICKELVHELDDRWPERSPVSPHVDLSRQALDQVDRGVRIRRVVLVSRREVDPDGTLVRVAEWIAPEGLTRDRRLLEPSP